MKNKKYNTYRNTKKHKYKKTRKMKGGLDDSDPEYPSAINTARESILSIKNSDPESRQQLLESLNTLFSPKKTQQVENIQLSRKYSNENENQNENTYEFIIRRHANSCDNIFKVLGLKYLIQRKTTDTEPSLSLWGIYATILLDTLLYEKEEYSPNLVFVSALVRTWMTATLLYLPFTGNELTLFIGPYIKEHGSDASNMPEDWEIQLEIFKQFLIYILFLRNILNVNRDKFSDILKPKIDMILDVLDKINNNSVINIVRFDGKNASFSINEIFDSIKNQEIFKSATKDAALKYTKKTLSAIPVASDNQLTVLNDNTEFEIHSTNTEYEKNPSDHMKKDKLMIENFISWVLQFLNSPEGEQYKKMIDNNKIYVVAHSGIMQYFIKNNNILSINTGITSNPIIDTYKNKIVKTNTWTIQFLLDIIENNSFKIRDLKLIEGMKQPGNKDIELECEQDCYVKEQDENKPRMRFLDRVRDINSSLDNKCIMKLDKQIKKKSFIDEGKYKFGIVNCGTKGKFNITLDRCIKIEFMSSSYDKIACNLFFNKNDNSYRVRRMTKSGSYDIEKDNLVLEQALEWIILWLNPNRKISYSDRIEFIIPEIEKLKIELLTFLNSNQTIFKKLRQDISETYNPDMMKRKSDRMTNIIGFDDEPQYVSVPAAGGSGMRKRKPKYNKTQKNKTHKKTQKNKTQKKHRKYSKV